MPEESDVPHHKQKMILFCSKEEVIKRLGNSLIQQQLSLKARLLLIMRRPLDMNEDGAVEFIPFMECIFGFFQEIEKEEREVLRPRLSEILGLILEDPTPLLTDAIRVELERWEEMLLA